MKAMLLPVIPTEAQPSVTEEVEQGSFVENRPLLSSPQAGAGETASPGAPRESETLVGTLLPEVPVRIAVLVPMSAHTVSFNP